MQKKIIIIAVIVILLATIFVPIEGTNAVESEFGSWIIEVEAEDENGDIIPLTMVSSLADRGLSVYHGGTQVNIVNYKIKASATGSGYDNCEIDMSAMGIQAKVYDTGGSNVYSYTKTYGPASVLIPVNGVSTLCHTYTIYMDYIEYGLDDGYYTIEFEISGTVQFRGVGSENGPWMDSSLPPGASFDVEVDNLPTVHCYKCVGNTLVDDWFEGECPDGWQSSPPNCDPDPPPPPETHPLTVYSFPKFTWCQCDGTTKTTYPAVFDLEDGTYTVKAYHSTYGTRTTSVTMSGSAKTITIYFKDPMAIIKLAFTLINVDTSIGRYYQDSNHYLGS